MSKLGLIAGNRAFPIHVARAARARGHEVVAIGLREETDPVLETEVQQMHWVSLSEVGLVPGLLQREGVKELVLAGQIRAQRLLGSEGRFAGVVGQLFRGLPDRSGNSAMKMAVQFLESQGFQILDSSLFLKEWLPKQGVLTKRPPGAEEKEDLKAGLEMARRIAQWGIGQTVVIRRKAVVAVEAMEGTDAAIRRGGQTAGPGCVVVKACEPSHDMRFDIPVIGEETLRTMKESGATCLGVEARRVLLFDLPKLLAEADRLDLSLVAL